MQDTAGIFAISNWMGWLLGIAGAATLTVRAYLVAREKQAERTPENNTPEVR